MVLHWLSSPWLRPCCVGRDLLQQLAGCLQGLHAPPALTPEAAGQAMVRLHVCAHAHTHFLRVSTRLVQGMLYTCARHAVQPSSNNVQHIVCYVCSVFPFSQEVLLHVVEALFQQPAALQQHHAAALTALVPSLASWVPAQDREVGVMATKLLCDLLLVLLWEPACCCYGEEQGQGEDGHSLGATLVGLYMLRALSMLGVLTVDRLVEGESKGDSDSILVTIGAVV